MKVKVCGITTIEQLQQLQNLAVDYAGLIFFEGSKRYAGHKLQDKKSEIQKLAIKKAGVFVNADMGFVKSCIRDFGLAAVQLHGDETVDYCAALQQEITVIKVFRITSETNDTDALVAPFQECCTYFLFDTATTQYGGSGRHFDWQILSNANIGKPFFLSGGIGSDDMGRLKSFAHPFFYGVDVNSRFETSPGIKDLAKVERFFNELKQTSWIK